MLKLKDDVPFINLIDLGYKCRFNGIEIMYYEKLYNNMIISINVIDREILCFNHNKKGSNFYTPKMYDHCIRDLVLKQYVKEI